ncbi:MAG: MBL fold metallo-hydrolase [Chloroflexia bacterium]|nr:MBL fold metallo-hydrolase [Chloroflexia bacterium]
MKIQQHGEYLWQVRSPWFPVNAYIVRESDGFTVIDSLLSAGDGDALQALAHKLGGEITRIVLTHGHMDHIGGFDRLQTIAPHAEVIVGAREARFLAGDLQLAASEQSSPLRGGYTKVQTQPTRLVAASDMIGSLRVLATPGHTPGHLSFFDTRDATIITGDALHTVGRVTITSELYWRFPFPTTATWSKSHANASVAQIAALNPSRLAPGHGPVVADPASQLAAALARVQGQ